VGAAPLHFHSAPAALMLRRHKKSGDFHRRIELSYNGTV